MPDNTYQPTVTQVAVNMPNGEHVTLPAYPINASLPGDAEQLFAAILHHDPIRYVIVWRNEPIGTAGIDNGLKWVDGPEGREVVCCFASGANNLLKRYIQIRLATLNLPREDWRRREATDGRR